MGTQKVMQKVTSNATAVAGTQQQQGQCVQVSQAMIGSQPTAQIISPLQVGTYYLFMYQDRKVMFLRLFF